MGAGGAAGLGATTVAVGGVETPGGVCLPLVPVAGPAGLGAGGGGFAAGVAGFLAGGGVGLRITAGLGGGAKIFR